MMIAVIGGNDADPSVLPDAEAVGREIAARGHVLVCGGRDGVMEAACRGARDAGGHTIGILPGSSKSEANQYVEFAIATNMGFARDAIIVQTADALVAVDGEYGTLTEIAMALSYGKPIVGIGTWRITPGGGVEDTNIIRASNAKDAVDKAVAAAGGT
jgi:uncharacterized protein (TIGR00725 family)